MNVKYLPSPKKILPLSEVDCSQAGRWCLKKFHSQCGLRAWGDLSVRLLPLAGKGMGELDKVHQTWDF